MPALNLNVVPAAAITAKPDSANAPNGINTASRETAVAATPVMPATTPAPSDENTQLRNWRLLSVFALVLWLLTLAAWVVSRQAQKHTTTLRLPSAPGGAATVTAQSALRTACTREDWPAAARALLTWSRAEHPDLRNLGELARLLDDPEQIAAIAELERACYGRGAAAGFNARLAAAFRKGPGYRRPAAAGTTRSALPALYPFQV